MLLIKSKYFEGLKLDIESEDRVKAFLKKLPPETVLTLYTKFGKEIEKLRIEDLYSL